MSYSVILKIISIAVIISNLTVPTNEEPVASSIFNINETIATQHELTMYNTTNCTTLCWAEINVVTEFLNGTERGHREYAIMLISTKELFQQMFAKQVTKGDIYELYDPRSGKSHTMNFTKTERVDDNVVRRNTKLVCGSGPVLVKDYVDDSALGKTVELRVGPKSEMIPYKQQQVEDTTDITTSTALDIVQFAFPKKKVVVDGVREDQNLVSNGRLNPAPMKSIFQAMQREFSNDFNPVLGAPFEHNDIVVLNTTTLATSTFDDTTLNTLSADIFTTSALFQISTTLIDVQYIRDVAHLLSATQMNHIYRNISEVLQIILRYSLISQRSKFNLKTSFNSCTEHDLNATRALLLKDDDHEECLCSFYLC